MDEHLGPHAGRPLYPEWLHAVAQAWWEEASFTSLEATVASLLCLGGLTAAVWWLSALALACFSAMLRRHNHLRLATRLERLTPRHTRRIAAIIIGINLATATAATAAEPNNAPAVSQIAEGTQELAPVPLRPKSPEPSIGPPSPAWTPVTHTENVRAEQQAPAPGWQPTQPSPSVNRLLGPTRTSSTEVVVRSGETLWGIAAAHLGPSATNFDIAEAWPRWYQANKDVIGPNPHHILPGTVLKKPA